MRYIWLVIVVLVIGYTAFNGAMGSVNVKSAAQASQVADEASAIYLALIALTLVFWFCREPAAAPAPKADRPAAPSTDSAPVQAFVDQRARTPTQIFAPLPDEPQRK